MIPPTVCRRPGRVRQVLPATLGLVWMLALSVRGVDINAQASLSPAADWIEPGAARQLAAEMSFANADGRLGLLLDGGPVNTAGHPFFTPLGENTRACVSCHQPSNGMSVSAAAIRERWRVTAGKDPLFEAIDGSNNPSLPQHLESSHSLLLGRGLFRVGLPWPPRPIAGRPITPEFSIEVVSDPTGVNLDATYGLQSARPTISVFRRPRPVANLKYVMTPDAIFNIKTGELTATDPDTGEPVGMNLMADTRHLTLTQQAVGAYEDHEEGVKGLSAAQLQTIVGFESRVYQAQAADRWGNLLAEAGGPIGLGPRAMLEGRTHVLANNNRDPIFRVFDAWKEPNAIAAPGLTPEARAFRASVARGNDIFMFRQFWIRDVTHINSVGLGNPIKRSCATCHNTQMTGMDLAPGWVDLGTTNYPTWTEAPVFNAASDLPVFKVTCHASATPHPYLGRVIYTTDPGRALITGRCNDVGSIVMQQFRGLAARAPYFSNGSSKTLRDLVDFYDRRFDMKLTDEERQDLVNFLSVL